MNYEFLPRNKKLRELSTELRNNATLEERILWGQYLRTYPVRFNRQRIIGNYIVDFYCDQARLVVEVDGMQHLQPDAMENDRERTRYFEAMDILVLRFSNQEVKQHLGAVCRKINETVKQRLDIMSRALEQDK